MPFWKPKLCECCQKKWTFVRSISRVALCAALVCMLIAHFAFGLERWYSVYISSLAGAWLGGYSIWVRAKFWLPTTIERAPGTLLMRICEFLLPVGIRKKVFEPVIADMQLEYFEALAEDRHWKAYWIKMRGRACFMMTALLQVPTSLISLVQRLWIAAG